MLIKALWGALFGLCFLAIGKWVMWQAYLHLSGVAAAPTPWTLGISRPWGALRPIDYFLLAGWPGVLLGAVTVIAFHLWRQGEQRRAVTLCRRIGFLATGVLGIKAGLVLYSAYSLARGLLATIGFIAVADMQPYWLFAVFDNLVSNGALQWSILMWIAGSVLKRRLNQNPALNSMEEAKRASF